MRERREACHGYGSRPLHLHDVLSRMVEGHPINRLDELLPWDWKTANPVKS